MTDQPPVTVSQPEWERGLWWMVGASGALHVLALAALLIVPHAFAHRPPLVSYTVDLIAPDKLGGTNLVAGGKGRVEGAPLAAREKPPEPKPEPKKAEPEKPVPPEVAKKSEPPKVEAKPKADEMTLADKSKKVVPAAVPTAAKRQRSPRAKAVPSPKVMAKAVPPPAVPTPQSKADLKAARDKIAARLRDEEIAAAIKRAAQQAGARGAGNGSEANAKPGGPLSVGPGEGAGGTVKGVEYLMYYTQMQNRIRQAWAWAGGTNSSLEAAVHFSISETGEVLDVRITHSSGDASYDASVERAVRGVNPLPPPPVAYRKEFSDVELTFRPEDLKM